MRPGGVRVRTQTNRHTASMETKTGKENAQKRYDQSQPAPLPGIPARFDGQCLERQVSWLTNMHRSPAFPCPDRHSGMTPERHEDER